jgi:hypothetical protein
VYAIRAEFIETANCAGSYDEATLLVAEPGQAANGGGWYTLAGNGRVNFGFNVKLVKGTGGNTGVPAQYRGQLLLINNSKWRCKGTLNSFSVTSTTTVGGSTGTCDLQWWDTSLNGGLGGWAVAATQIPFTIIYKAGNTGKGKTAGTPASFGATLTHTPVAPQPSSLPNSGLIELKGGNVQMTK